MMQTLAPAHIAAAALVMQFSIVAIVFVGSLVLRVRDPYVPGYTNRFQYLGAIIGVGLLTLALLLFSNEVSSTWRTAFGLNYNLISSSTALLTVLLIDIFGVSFLVTWTGGSYQSPFTPLYFVVPALALFLRESPSRICLYVVCVFAFFTINLPKSMGDDEADYLSYWTVSVGCFGLATLIGFVTRPH